MFSPIRSLLPLFLLILAAIPVAPGQSPILPADSSIAAYVRLRDVPALSRQCAAALQTTGVSVPDTIVTNLVAASLHDPHMALVQPGQALTMLTLRAPDGVLYPAAVLPGTVDPRYAEACAVDAKMRIVALEEILLMAPAGSEKWLSQDLTKAIVDLHGAIHPCDFVVYAQTDALTQSARQMENARQMLGLRRPSGAGKSGVDSARKILEQIEWLGIQICAQTAPPRLIANLKARGDTPLFRFLSTPPPEANALPRFLNHEGWFLAAGEIDGPALSEVLDSALASDVSRSGTESIRAALLLNNGPWALRIAPEGFTALLTPSSPHAAVRQIVEFMETLPGTPVATKPTAPVAPRPLAPGRQSGQSGRKIATDSSGRFEGFEVTRFYPASMSESERTVEKAVAAAAFVGSHVAWCAPAQHIETLLRKMTLIDVTGDSLLSQKTFVEGANLYMDVRSPLDSGPWHPERAILLTVRWEAGAAQWAMALPPEVLASLPRKPTPAPELQTVVPDTNRGDETLPSPIAP